VLIIYDGSITIPEFPRQSERIFDLCTEKNKVVHVDHGDVCQSLREASATGDLVYPVLDSTPDTSPGTGELDTDAESADDGDGIDEPVSKRLRKVSPPTISVAWYDDTKDQWYCSDYPELIVPLNHDRFREALLSLVVIRITHH
jgi:hypothetical protein